MAGACGERPVAVRPGAGTDGRAAAACADEVPAGWPCPRLLRRPQQSLAVDEYAFVFFTCCFPVLLTDTDIVLIPLVHAGLF